MRKSRKNKQMLSYLMHIWSPRYKSITIYFSAPIQLNKKYSGHCNIYQKSGSCRPRHEHFTSGQPGPRMSQAAPLEYRGKTHGGFAIFTRVVLPRWHHGITMVHRPHQAGDYHVNSKDTLFLVFFWNIISSWSRHGISNMVKILEIPSQPFFENYFVWPAKNMISQW